MIETLKWEEGTLKILDQRRLPLDIIYLTTTDYREVATAIKTLTVRGAPAIGVAAAYGLCLAALEYRAHPDFKAKVEEAKRELAATRPTAVNLFWALDRMEGVLERWDGADPASAVEAMIAEASAIEREDLETNYAIGRHGKEVVLPGSRIITHCNAGALATVGYGTALGVIRAAHAEGKVERVWVDETRPLLQGSRLTAWELRQDGIPAVLITDNMAGWVMKRTEANLVVFGADRIAANGDTANKIGSYSLAVLAKEHGIPVYVAAPLSTVDLNLSSGDEIPIEERDHDEVRLVFGQPVSPPDVPVFNPAFDVTPARYITGIITEAGVLRPPYEVSLRRAVRGDGV